MALARLPQQPPKTLTFWALVLDISFIVSSILVASVSHVCCLSSYMRTEGPFSSFGEMFLFPWNSYILSLNLSLGSEYVRKKMNCFITFSWAAALLNRKDVSKHPDRRENTLSPHWRWYNKGFRLFMQVKNGIWGKRLCVLYYLFLYSMSKTVERETTGGVRWGLQEIWENVSKIKSNRRMNNGMDKNVTILITFQARWNQNMGWLELLCLEIN